MPALTLNKIDPAAWVEPTTGKVMVRYSATEWAIFESFMAWAMGEDAESWHYRQAHARAALYRDAVAAGALA